MFPLIMWNMYNRTAVPLYQCIKSSVSKIPQKVLKKIQHEKQTRTLNGMK